MENQFTTRELQILKSLVRQELREMNQTIESCTNVAKVLYRASNKEDNSFTSKLAFTSLNRNREVIRGEAERLRKFETIQKKIKSNLT